MPRKRSLTISIPQPCTQSWDAMTPEAGGRFCARCQKTVMDFTGMTDVEIARRLDQANAPACGRMNRSQLNRPLEYWVVPANRAWPRLALGTLITLAAAMPHALLGQSPTPTVQTERNPMNAQENPPYQDSKGIHHLKGLVIEAATGAPKHMVMVFVTDPSTGTYTNGAFTDEAGKFEVRIPIDAVQDSFKLLVKDIVSEGVELTWSKSELPRDIVIAMAEPEPEIVSSLVGAIAYDRKTARKARRTYRREN